jgi:predicted amidohydrolase
MPVKANMEQNLRRAEEELCCREGQIDLAVLPEMFCCPYESRLFPVYAQEAGGPVWQKFSRLAAKLGIYLIAGSVPEREDGRIYNTAYVFDREGKQIARHRKVHLFDINVAGGQYFMESETLTAGDSFTVFDTEFGRMGVCICYDIRFPETFRCMGREDIVMAFVPAAFNMTTGPAHWELSFRMRALDNQIFLCGCSSARDPEAGYVAYGHTILTDPWGRVRAQLDEKPGVLMQTVDLEEEKKVREQLPLLRHRRRDLYE